MTHGINTCMSLILQKNLKQNKKYLNATGISIFEESKLQFNTEYKIDSGMID